MLPKVRTVETKTLHRGVAGARHNFLPLPAATDKLDVLLQVCFLGCMLEGELAGAPAGSASCLFLSYFCRYLSPQSPASISLG